MDRPDKKAKAQRTPAPARGGEPEWDAFLPNQGAAALPTTLIWAALAAGSLLAAWRHWCVPEKAVVPGYADLPGVGAFFLLGTVAGALAAAALYRLGRSFGAEAPRLHAALQWGAAPLLFAWVPLAGVSPAAGIWNVYWMTAATAAGCGLGAWVLGGLDAARRPAWATRRAAWKVLATAAAVTAFGYSATTILGFHQLIDSSYTDFGGFHNAAWNTWHTGHFMWCDHWSGNIWADHVSVFLLLPGLLLFLWGKAEFFLILQAAGLASAAVPVFLFTRRLTSRTPFALAAAAAMLLSPFLGRVAMYEFHDLSFGMAAMAWLLWACEGAAPAWLYFILGGLALAVREDMALPVVAVGLWEATVGRRPKRGLPLMAMAFVWGALCVNVIIPSALGGWKGAPEKSPSPAWFRAVAPSFVQSHLYWKSGGGGHLERYEQFAEPGQKSVTYGSIVKALVAHPVRSFGPLFGSARLPNYALLFLPLLLLPLLGWERLWIAAPVFFLHALANWNYQNELDCQYTAPLIPVLFFSAASGARRLARWTARDTNAPDGSEAPTTRLWRALAAALLGAALVAHLFTARWLPGLPPPLSAPEADKTHPVPAPYDGRQHFTLLALPFRPAQWRLDDHAQMIQALRDIVPPRAGICVPDNLAPFFTSREIVRSFRRYASKPNDDLDYILFSLRVPTYMKQPDLVAQLQQMLSDPAWEVLWTHQDLLLLARPGRTPETVKQSLAALSVRYVDRPGAADLVRQLTRPAPGH